MTVEVSKISKALESNNFAVFFNACGIEEGTPRRFVKVRWGKTRWRWEYRIVDKITCFPESGCACFTGVLT